MDSNPERDALVSKFGYDPANIHPTHETKLPVIVMMWNREKRGWNTHIFAVGYQPKPRPRLEGTE